MPEPSVLGVSVGDTATFEKSISEDDIVAFARATGDEQPLHLDDAYAAKPPFKPRNPPGLPVEETAA